MLGRIGRKAVHPSSIVEILRNVEMREQPRVLEHIADAAAPGRHMNAGRGVVHGLAVDHDGAAVGPQEPGDHVDQRGLAGA
ncbi:hypothetical protein ABIF53_004359 [Bradyrhizobium japonicum]